jgi:periplasmic copper chaperone A
MSFITRARVAFAISALFHAVPVWAEDGIEIHDPYAIASPGGMSGAAFMTIHNHGGAPDRLLDVRSDAAAKVELHTHTENSDGVMTMVHVEEGFDLPTDGEILLDRGGNHIMFMGLSGDWADGKVLSVSLVFETAGEITVEVPVDSARMTGDAMDMGAMEDGTTGYRHHAHATATLDQTGMSDTDAIVAVLKAAFDTPDNPLTVDPVVVERDHALASWAQGGNGGRALLTKGDAGWEVVLCGGPDLRMPAFLKEHGVSAADRLSAAYNAAEEALGADKVALSSSFEGVVMMSGDMQSH